MAFIPLFVFLIVVLKSFSIAELQNFRIYTFYKLDCIILCIVPLTPTCKQMCDMRKGGLANEMLKTFKCPHNCKKRLTILG